MANEINAVAGQLWGVPVGQVYTAGPGVVIDNVHKTVRVDETVLWEDLTNTTQLYSGTTNFNLSESFMNFERIKVYYRHSFSGNMWDTSEGIVLANTDLRLGVNPQSQGDNAWTLIDRAIFNFPYTTPTKFVVTATTRAGLSISGSTVTGTTSNNGIIPMRVVGINRVA